AVGPERVWVAARGSGEVDGIGQGNGELDFRVDVPHPVAIAVGFDSVWAVSRDTDSLYRLDPLEGAKPLQIPLGDGADPRDVATGGRWVWVTEGGRQEVARL